MKKVILLCRIPFSKARFEPSGIFLNPFGRYLAAEARKCWINVLGASGAYLITEQSTKISKTSGLGYSGCPLASEPRKCWNWVFWRPPGAIWRPSHVFSPCVFTCFLPMKSRKNWIERCWYDSQMFAMHVLGLSTFHLMERMHLDKVLIHLSQNNLNNGSGFAMQF